MSSKPLIEGNPLSVICLGHLVRGMRDAESRQQQQPTGETCPGHLPDSSSRAKSSQLKQTTAAAGFLYPGQQCDPLMNTDKTGASTLTKACAGKP